MIKMAENNKLKVYGELTDMIGGRIWVQESSSTHGGIWIYCNNDNMSKPVPHLSIDQAKELISILNKAIEDMKQ